MMASVEPFDQIIGAADIYFGPVGEAFADVDSAPAGNWIDVGKTNEGVVIKSGGSLTFWRDDQTQGPRKATRPEEDVIASVKIIGLTLENVARILNNVSNVATDAGPPATKRTPLQKGFNPTEYAIIVRAELGSPYGSFPAQQLLPRVVIDGEPEYTYAKDGRAEYEIDITVISDDTQAAGDEMGFIEAQTA